MDLREYMRKQELNGTEMSEKLGVHPSAVSKWLKKQRIPSRMEMLKIYAITKGMVTPNDFYL